MRTTILLTMFLLTLPLWPQVPEPERSPWALSQAAPPSALRDRLDHGLLDPAWFGPGIAWGHVKGLDFCWVRPGPPLDCPRVYLAPWELPRFLKGKDALDHALGGQASEELQTFLRQSLSQPEGIRLAEAPGDSPYHAVGRVVEATQIREGAETSLAFLAGLPTVTWDFKVVDVRNGATVLATHHRMVGAGHVAWIQFVSGRLAALAGRPGDPAGKDWEMPSAALPLPEGGTYWSRADFRLEGGTICLLPWIPATNSGQALWRAWTSGLGQVFASAMLPALTQRMAGRNFGLSEPALAAYLLQGRVYAAPRYLRAHYQARLLEAASGQVVARFDIPAPASSDPAPKVADRLVEGLLQLHRWLRAEPPASASPPIAPLSGTWIALERLAPGPGPLDATWISPGFNLRGHTLQVGDWLAPDLPRQRDDTDRAFAETTTRLAPGWLLGALAPFLEQGLALSRVEGDLRLEGRVVDISEANLRNFGRAMAAGFTLGLGGHSFQIVQIRVVDQVSHEPLLLAEQRVVSFKAASSGTSYKAMKWMAQDFVPWLIQVGLKTDAKATSD